MGQRADGQLQYQEHLEKTSETRGGRIIGDAMMVGDTLTHHHLYLILFLESSPSFPFSKTQNLL